MNILGIPSIGYPICFVNNGLDLADIKTFCLFVLFFNHLGIPTGTCPESFIKTTLDMADTLSI